MDMLREKLEITKAELDTAVKHLEKKYTGECGIRLLTFNHKLQLATNPDYKDQVGLVLNTIREKEFTKTILECAAIIAYKQPITKGELEALRGLNCDYAIHTLLDLKMIEPVGRKDAVGRPILYATTDNFLKRFKLNSIEDLPDYDTLMENIAKLHADEPDSYLYANNVYVDSQSQNEAVEDNGSGASDTGNLSGNTTSDADRDDLPDFLQDLDADDIIKIE